MQKRLLGRAGLKVSELVLGGGVVGGVLVLPDEAVRRAALEKIVKAGVDWIDTAALYGNGVSEQTLGRHLPQLSPRPRISTKFTILPGDRADIFGAVARGLEGSLRRLNMPRVDLLQLHNQISCAERRTHDFPGSRACLRRRCRCARQAESSRPDRRQRPHGGGRDDRRARSDQQRPFRYGAGLLQYDQPERGVDPCAGRMGE